MRWGEFTKAEVAKVNRPFPDDEFHVFRHEDKLDTIFYSRIPCLFRHTPADFECLQAARGDGRRNSAEREPTFLGIRDGQLGAVVEAGCLCDPPAGQHERFGRKALGAGSRCVHLGSGAEGLNPRAGGIHETAME
jgi:hypothetical protein